LINLCPLVDDVLDEADSLAKQLCRQGVPFEVRPVMPAPTTRETYRLIASAKPFAAMVDYYLTARPGTKSIELARQLLDHGVHTVVVTKDRNIVDRKSISCGGHVIPVYFKQRLVSDQAYLAQLVQNLGGQAVPVEQGDYTEKLYALQEKALRGTISAKEKRELRILLARLRLEENEEAARIEQAQTGIKRGVDSLIDLIRDVTSDLDDELKAKHAVHSKTKGSQVH
jgi:hypothetical protein